MKYSKQSTEMKKISDISNTTTEVERMNDESLEDLFEKNIKKVKSKNIDTLDDISYAESIMPEQESEIG
jgi:hypothetical protein